MLRVGQEHVCIHGNIVVQERHHICKIKTEMNMNNSFGECISINRTGALQYLSCQSNTV